MSLRAAAFCGMVAALAVPAILVTTGTVEEGLLAGRVVHLPIGGGVELHWSWTIFGVTTLAVWALLVAARNR